MNIFLKLIIILIICYFAYKLYQQNQIKNAIKNINNSAFQTIKITPNTVFVFDVDGVILTPDFKKFCEIFFKSPKVELFSILLYPKLIYHIYKYSEDETTQEILEYILKTDPDFKYCINTAYNLSYAKKVMPQTAQLIEYLKEQNFKLLILSNETITGMEVLSKQHEIFNKFDDMFLTTPKDNYLKKPNPEFYKKFLKWINYKNIENKDLIFIDDRLKNIIAAKECGIPSIVFTNINELNKILFK